MNDKQLESISSKVRRQFPEVSGSKPQVRRQSSQKSKSSPATYLITYRGKSKAADGKSITRIVRVTANDDGKIIKISTSR
jgi:predicted lipoprotein